MATVLPANKPCLPFTPQPQSITALWLVLILRKRAFSLPGQFALQSESSNRTLADSLPGLSLPGPFVTWPFHSLELSHPGTYALWLFRSGHRRRKVCGNGGGQSQEVWGTAEVPKAPRSSAIGSRREKRSWRRVRWAVGRGLCPSPENFFDF